MNAVHERITPAVRSQVRSSEEVTMKRTLTFGGVKFTSSSQRRFVVYGFARDGVPYIVKRSDNVDTAKTARNKVFNGVVVDFVGRSVLTVDDRGGRHWTSVLN